MKGNKIKMTKLLGIDYGDKRVGLAIAELGSIAVPYKVVKNTEKLFEELQEIVEAENINEIIIGLPHSLSGEPNERLEITQKFIEDLGKFINLPIKEVDEQLTSKLYTQQGVTKEIDKHAATAILDTYLEQNNGKL